MRTTLTLDDDVAARLKGATREGRRKFRQVVNETLRAGLDALERKPRERVPHRTQGFDLGPSLVGSLDNIEEVLARTEGDNHR